MKDHKPNRRQRRAMNRIGDKMANQVFKRNLIKKTNNEEKETHTGDSEILGDVNDRPSELDDTSK